MFFAKTSIREWMSEVPAPKASASSSAGAFASPEELFRAKLAAWRTNHPEPSLEEINAAYDRRMANDPAYRLVLEGLA